MESTQALWSGKPEHSGLPLMLCLSLPASVWSRLLVLLFSAGAAARQLGAHILCFGLCIHPALSIKAGFFCGRHTLQHLRSPGRLASGLRTWSEADEEKSPRVSVAPVPVRFRTRRTYTKLNFQRGPRVRPKRTFLWRSGV